MIEFPVSCYLLFFLPVLFRFFHCRKNIAGLIVPYLEFFPAAFFGNAMPAVAADNAGMAKSLSVLNLFILMDCNFEKQLAIQHIKHHLQQGERYERYSEADNSPGDNFFCAFDLFFFSGRGDISDSGDYKEKQSDSTDQAKQRLG